MIEFLKVDLKNKKLWSAYIVKGNSTFLKISFLFHFQNEIPGKQTCFCKGFDGTAYSDGKWLFGSVPEQLW